MRPPDRPPPVLEEPLRPPEDPPLATEEPLPLDPPFVPPDEPLDPPPDADGLELLLTADAIPSRMDWPRLDRGVGGGDDEPAADAPVEPLLPAPPAAPAPADELLAPALEEAPLPLAPAAAPDPATAPLTAATPTPTIAPAPRTRVIAVDPTSPEITRLAIKGINAIEIA